MLIRLLADYGIDWGENGSTDKPGGGEVTKRDEVFRRFMEMCSNIDRMKASPWTEHYRLRCRLVSEVLRDLKLGSELLDYYKGFDSNYENILFEMLCKIHCNAFGVKNSQGDDCGNALFQVACALNHSCEPNAVIYPTVEKMQVRAREAIEDKQEILINYSMEPDADKRNSYLNTNYFFICQCSQCQTLDKQTRRETDQQRQDEKMVQLEVAETGVPPTSDQ
jgi:hypothetical protein